MYDLLCLNRISTVIQQYLQPQDYSFLPPEDIEESLAKADAVLARSYNMHDLDIPSDLLAIARAGAGVNNIPIDACSEKGIVVFNSPGANANGVKELVIAGMIAASRNLLDGVKWANELEPEGERVPKLVEKGKGQFVGHEIKGKTIGVVGLGAIGLLVANVATALGMKVIGFDPFIKVDSAWYIDSNVDRVLDLDQLTQESDFISLHLPLNDDTKEMINKDFFAKCKEDAIILNFARANLVQVDDLLEALKNRTINKYVTDFPTVEVLNNEHVIPIPHLGASTPEAERNCAIMAATQVKDYIENGNIKNSVNFPETILPVSDSNRLAIAYNSLSGVGPEINKILSQAQPQNMITNTRGNLGYVLANLSQMPTAEQLKEIENLDGVLRVRCLKGACPA